MASPGPSCAWTRVAVVATLVATVGRVAMTAKAVTPSASAKSVIARRRLPCA